MKKILFISILLIGYLNANGLNFSAPSILNTNKELNSVSKSKLYSDLINTLKISPSGEHAFYLGVIYLNGLNKPDENGDTIKKDISLAKKYFKKAISLGYYNAAQILGSLYVYNENFITEKNNIDKAIKYLNLALKNNLYEGTTVLADIYINYKNNPEKGIEYLKIGAEHNIPTAQLFLAILYNWGYKDKSGYELKKDPYAAQVLLTKACTNKNITENVKKFCESKSVKKKEK